jgi:hypothetical protein
MPWCLLNHKSLELHNLKNVLLASWVSQMWLQLKEVVQEEEAMTGRQAL